MADTTATEQLPAKSKHEVAACPLSIQSLYCTCTLRLAHVCMVGHLTHPCLGGHQLVGAIKVHLLRGALLHYVSVAHHQKPRVSQVDGMQLTALDTKNAGCATALQSTDLILRGSI